MPVNYFLDHILRHKRLLNLRHGLNKPVAAKQRFSSDPSIAFLPVVSIVELPICNRSGWTALVEETAGDFYRFLLVCLKDVLKENRHGEECTETSRFKFAS